MNFPAIDQSTLTLDSFFMTSSILRNCTLLVLALMLVNAFVPSVISSHSVGGDCPKVIVECPTDSPGSDKTYTVKAHLEGEDSNQELSYNWWVSGGEIIDGQGTASLKIRISDPRQVVTVTVEVKGLKEDCPRVASCTFNVS